MFRIIDDTIEYDRKPIARFLPGLSATLYDIVVHGVEHGLNDGQREKEIAEALEANDDEWKVKCEELEAKCDEMDPERERFRRALSIYEDSKVTLSLVEQIGQRDKTIETLRAEIAKLKKLKKRK